MTEDPLTTCPRCETDALERLVSRTSFALKGGGWYADGYGPPKTEAEAKTEGEAKADGDDTKKGGDEKGDAKGESGKSESKSKSTEPAQDAKPKTTKSEPERAEPSPNPAANG